jgi:hypothetical protein
VADEAVPPGLPASPSPASPPAPGRIYKPWIVALLSFLVPGFGQIYNRDYVRGIVWLIITPGFWIGTGGALGWLCHLISAYTAYQRAQPMPASGIRPPSGSRGLSFLRRRAPA